MKYPEKVHYGCGARFLEDWLNIDNAESFSVPKSKYTSRPNYVKVNLEKDHPFTDNLFKFGFAEDFLEHLDQIESIIFLSECYRTFQDGGVFRLSFPGLEGVLKRHYGVDGKCDTKGLKNVAYTMWQHKYFFSKEELILVTKYVGFKKIQFVEYGKSAYQELCNLDSRSGQIGFNIYAELTK